MRDLLFLSVFSPLTLLSLVHPWSGLLAFGWIAFLKPHSMLFTMAGQIPFNLVVALTTALGWMVSKEKKTVQFDLTAGLILALIAITALSTAFSLSPGASQVELIKLMKTMVFLFLLKVMLTSRVRLHGYIWLMAFAMGFFGLNGGALFIISAGAHKLTGPAFSEIGDRNHLALAMLLAVPLMNYLRLQSRHRWMQLGLMGAMVMTVMAVLATYSRGGFIGLLAMGAFLWWKSKSRILALIALLVVAVGLHRVAPDRWKERMGTIETAQTEDNSFKLRLLSWYTYAAAAIDRPLTGAGPYALQDGHVYFRYAPGREVIDVANDRPRAAHSIYFQVLGDLGFIGFFIYIALLVTGFRNARWLSRQARRRPELDWMGDLGRMIRVSMIAFCVSGAALSMAYYDYFLSLLIVLSSVRQMAMAALGERGATVPRRSRRAATTSRGDRARSDGAAERPHQPVDTTA
ncbi:MAG: putative O-glycosylation ligase, exosortase A system-associated, partial [Alphaproteobacteria bacterium]|nr:putative O-glycosylation ligase, exosortase A system-associated [Alphaproteobacteria bacterium]